MEVKIIFKEVKLEPMRFDRVKYILDMVCNDLTALGVSGRLRTHNRIKNELGAKALPIEPDSVGIVEQEYQAILHAREMLHAIEPVLRQVFAEDKMLYQESDYSANDRRKNGKAKFPLRLSEMLAILGGGFLGALLTRILLG